MDDDEIAALLGIVGDKSRVTTWLGSYRGLSDSKKLLVDVGGSRIPCESFSAYRPAVNESVWVWFLDQRPFMMGPAIAPPGKGTVQSVANGMAVVITDLGNIPARFSSGVTAGAEVQLLWGEGAFAIPRAATTTAPPVAPGAPGGGSAPITKDFLATDSGQYYSRWQNNAPRASDNVKGLWTYGSSIADSIPDDVANPRGKILLPNADPAMGVCRIGRHTANWTQIPGGAGWPGSTDEVALSPRSGWVDLPDAIVRGLITTPGGITVTSGNGDNQWPGTQQDGSSGLIRITY